jgi:hypothetical protein
MKRTLSLFVFGVVLVAASSVLAQQGIWEKKEWQKWTADDCKKMLEDSPWARRWAQSVPQMAQFSKRDGAGTASNDGGVGNESKLEVYYIVQLRSAKPIREALMRQQEIQIKYDSMDEKQRAGIDQQVSGVVNKTYDDVVIVHVLYGANVQQYERTLANYWQKIPPGTVPLQAFLDLASGKKVVPLKMNSPRNGQNEFELIFPRVVDGESVATADSKILGVEFMTPTVGQVPGDRLHIEFKPDKMKVNGAVEF